MKRRVLVYTDSRGQHTPSGAPVHDVFGLKLAQHTDLEVEVVLCPMKWTTTLDFLDYLKQDPASNYDWVVLQTGIVDWSPRPQQSAINDLYNNLTPSNLSNFGLNTRDYSKKVVNNKKPSFDALFDEQAMAEYLGNGFDVEYEGQATVNMYGLEMAKRHLLPRLAEIDNLIFVNSNRFVPGWEGDFKRGRPANISITEQYSELFRDVLGPAKVIDLLQWQHDEVKRFTCDNLHLSKEGSDWIYERVCERIGIPGSLSSSSMAVSKAGAGQVGEKTSCGDAPFISVIVPVYNVEAYLRECLDSLARQTDDNFEVIIIDDGSTDNSAEIVAEYCDLYPNFIAHRQENSGLGGARNTGIDICNGDFLTFVDSDDYVSEDYISSFRSIQAEGDHDVVTGGFARVSDDGKLLSKQKIATQIIPDEYNGLRPFQILLGVYRPSISCARLYRKELLISSGVRFKDRMPHEDLCFTYKILFHAKSFGEVEPDTYFYRQRPGSLSSATSKAHVDALIEQWDDTDAFLAETQASTFEQFLAARRTLILTEGIWNRSIKAPPEVQSHFCRLMYQNLPRLQKLVTLVHSFPSSDRYAPRHIERLIETLRKEPGLAMNDTSLEENFSQSEVIFPHENINFDAYNRKEVTQGSVATPELRKLYNKFKGHRCFIIGNGPSLNKHDLSLLEGEYVFAVNSFYYKTDETGFVPTFFVVEDNMVMTENIDRIRSYDAPYKFFPSDYRSIHPEGDNVYFFRMNQGFYQKSSPYYCVPRFSADASNEMYCGQSVTYINLQLAYFLGFTEVYLIGMDFDYVIPKEHERSGNHILSTTDDPNHFHKDYFGKGKTWKDPKLERVGMNYRQAKVSYEAVGRKIYNATVGGKLEIFERADYEAMLRDPVTGQKKPTPKASVVTGSADIKGAVESVMSNAPAEIIVTSRSIPSSQSTPIATDGKKRSSKLGKLKRDPHAFFRDAHSPVLHPLKYLFRPSKLTKVQAETLEKARRDAGGFFSFLPVSRKRLARNRSELRSQHISLEASLRTEIARLQKNANTQEAALRVEIAQLRTQAENQKAQTRADKQALDRDIAAQQSAGKAVQSNVETLKGMTERQEKTSQFLRQRVMASEQQIGALRYPDAPKTLVFFGHHKCASRLFRNEIFGGVAEATGAQIHQYKIKSPPFHYSKGDELDLYNIDFEEIGEGDRHVVLFSNATPRILKRLDGVTSDWKGIRVIRDPRQVLVSNYFHHKGNHHTELNGWVYDQLKIDQPLLRELPKEEGMIHELDHISKDIIETQIIPSFDDQRILTIKLEDFTESQEMWLKRISEFLGIADIAGVDLARTYANPDSSAWQHHFTSRLRDIFKDRYGQALIDLGYADDLNW